MRVVGEHVVAGRAAQHRAAQHAARPVHVRLGRGVELGDEARGVLGQGVHRLQLRSVRRFRPACAARARRRAAAGARTGSPAGSRSRFRPGSRPAPGSRRLGRPPRNCRWRATETMVSTMAGRCALPGMSHEAPVDLELVQRQPGQISERRIAGAKVINQKRMPSATSSESAPPSLRSLDQQTLGDLQRQARRVSAGLGEHAATRLRQNRLVKLARTDVDGKTHTTLAETGNACEPTQASRNTHSPSATINPVSSATGMNCIGTTMPRVGCRQRTSGSAPTSSARVDLRLQVQLKLAVAIASLNSCSSARRCWPRTASRTQKTRSNCGRRLGAIHRGVGLAQQVVDPLTAPSETA